MIYQDKETTKFRDVLQIVKSKYSHIVASSYAARNNGSISKDIAERIIVEMICRSYFAEEVIENLSGFAAGAVCVMQTDLN
jgi:hypothetical protein